MSTSTVNEVLDVAAWPTAYGGGIVTGSPSPASSTDTGGSGGAEAVATAPVPTAAAPSADSAPRSEEGVCEGDGKRRGGYAS